MIAHSRLVFASVLAASFGLHLGAMTLVLDEPETQMEGGSQDAESSLGSSFTDLAKGVQRPVEAVDVFKPTTAGAVKAVAPETSAAKHTPPQTVTSATVTTAALAPDAAERSAGPPAPRAPLVPASPAPSETLAAEPDAVVAALPDTTGATPVSVRPKLPVNRPDPSKPAPKRTATKPAPKVAKPAGNANRNAKAGTQSGKASKPAQSRQASKATTNKAQGNAAASNYPGQVMRRISRVSRPRTSARGVAVIRFSIAANGGLASASVARSSGSATLDRAALGVVQKAQPFPRPPAGARRSYSIKIKGR